MITLISPEIPTVHTLVNFNQREQIGFNFPTSGLPPWIEYLHQVNSDTLHLAQIFDPRNISTGQENCRKSSTPITQQYHITAKLAPLVPCQFQKQTDEMDFWFIRVLVWHRSLTPIVVTTMYIYCARAQKKGHLKMEKRVNLMFLNMYIRADIRISKTAWQFWWYLSYKSNI